MESEARAGGPAEAAASRLPWATGHYSNEYYVAPEVHLEGMVAHLRGGQELIGPGGVIYHAQKERRE